MPSVARDLQPSGDLKPVLIPKHGYYINNELDKRGRFKRLVLPEDVPLKYQARTRWLELALRARLATKGFVRGLKGEGVIGVGRLYATVFRAEGSMEHLGLLSTKVITDAGVGALVDDWDGSGSPPDITNFNFHGCGTGNTAEAAGDTALVTESTTALNPDSTRATGTKSQPAANQLRSVGTPVFDAIAAIVEHGLFSQAGTGGGLLWDRSVFSAINVDSGDSIQFTYTVTFSSGG